MSSFEHDQRHELVRERIARLQQDSALRGELRDAGIGGQPRQRRRVMRVALVVAAAPIGLVRTASRS